MNIFQELITSALILVQIILSLFPLADEAKLTQIDTAVMQVNNTIGTANYYLPMELLSTFVGIIISIELSILLFKSVNWLVNKIRGSG